MTTSVTDVRTLECNDFIEMQVRRNRMGNNTFLEHSLYQDREQYFSRPFFVFGFKKNTFLEHFLY